MQLYRSMFSEIILSLSWNLRHFWDGRELKSCIDFSNSVRNTSNGVDYFFLSTRGFCLHWIDCAGIYGQIDPGVFGWCMYFYQLLGQFACIYEEIHGQMDPRVFGWCGFFCQLLEQFDRLGRNSGSNGL